MIELTQDQREKLDAGGAVDVTDPTTECPHVLLRKDVYERAKLLPEDDPRPWRGKRLHLARVAIRESETAPMLHYPKIPGSGQAPLERCLAFEKYDGTNLHFDWDRDFSWHRFGTRRDAFDLTEAGIEQFAHKHAYLHQCVGVFRSTLAQEIERIFHDNTNYREFQSIQVFAEFLGPNSFAGLHKGSDLKELRLFDVKAEPFGMIGPWQFVSDFGHLPIARVVYEGKLTGKFADDVRQGKYDVEEGVICKGGSGGEDVWMAKIKTNAYMARLKQAFADHWEDYWE